MTTVNSSMVVLAREARRMTQSAVAERANVSQGWVSKLEGGLYPDADSEKLGRIANVLEVPVSLFLRSGQSYGSTIPMHHRRRQAAPAAAVRQVEAQLNLLRLRVDALLRSVEIRSDLEFTRMSLDDLGEPEEVARMARVVWRLPNGPIRNLVALVESAGGIVVRVPFPTTHMDGVSQWIPPSPPTFMLSDALPWDRLRWTLAHEIGHVLMHHEPTQDPEREANRFASELLAPSSVARADLQQLTLEKAGRLKPYWGMSMAALVMRARDLGTISADRARRLMIEISSKGWRKREPLELPPEPPQILERLVQMHREHLGFSEDELAGLLGMIPGREEPAFGRPKSESSQRRLRVVLSSD